MEVRGRGLPLCPTEHHSEGILGGEKKMRKHSLNQTNKLWEKMLLPFQLLPRLTFISQEVSLWPLQLLLLL